ncbi:esterase/lipase family protein [Sporohalobacter salinus]|uniref:esterase/lipase family protein n=1 Tax=Sporohalobacter salinus TaxID=1494606 RepID=UPI0019618A90|nr:hypothetical protein [Sporohalobacter salinus]MBM7622818.1 triacylglycerol lipase [Sporohalobacter salinus]
MKKISGIMLACIILLCLPLNVVAAKGNDYPIVLVHGFAGWGGDEILGFKYWGGFSDFQEELKSKEGYNVKTAVVGPFSSNWDRACELYAYIKGGTVDYGKAHAEKYGHDRYGRTYPGIYPQWGEINSKIGKVNKIHLVGHSMGGQTIRMLVQLLEEGRVEELTNTNSNVSPLFKGDHSWVHSVTTISSPHDGTTAANEGNHIISFAQDIISSLGAIVGGSQNLVFDFKLDQWGLERKSGQSFSDYADKVWNSSIWNKENKDIALWDLSTKGAKKINQWVKTHDNVYYFSWTTEATTTSPVTDHKIPEVSAMNPLFYPNSYVIGSYTGHDSPNIDKSWWSNDGVVNTISQNGPKIGADHSEIINWDYIPEPSVFEPGVWNHMPVLNSVDHCDIIGIKGDNVNEYKFYSELCNRLMSLPTQ